MTFFGSTMSGWSDTKPMSKKSIAHHRAMFQKAQTNCSAGLDESAVPDVQPDMKTLCVCVCVQVPAATYEALSWCCCSVHI